MKSPFTGKEMRVVKEWQTLTYRKEEFKILFHSFLCEETGKKFEDENFAQLNYNQLINQYRAKYTIPSPEVIKQIREKYKLSATKMSEILGLGINSYRLYESGEIPSQSNAKLIQLAENPLEFRRLVDLCGTIDSVFRTKTLHRINALIEQQNENKFGTQFENHFFGNRFPNAYTGYMNPSLVKFSEMVKFFTEKMEPWKTKLNKLLFYADFEMFKRTGFGISGVTYCAIPMGPAPDKFGLLFEYLADSDEIDIWYTNFKDGGTGEQFKPHPGRKFNSKFFNEQELKVMEFIAEKFSAVSTNRIIEMSHKEKAWIENEAEKGLIDYRYSFELN